MEYHVFAMPKTPELSRYAIEESPPLSRKRMVPSPENLWSASVPLLVKAMVLTRGQLFIAGPPDLLDEKLLNFNQVVPALQARAQEQADAWQGHRGGLLWSLSPADGKRLAEYHLDAPSIFNGLAVANDKLFVVQQNGVVHCLD